MTLIGYSRVSTGDQTADLQTDALTAAGCERIYPDICSGALDRRPQLDALLDYIRPGDVLVVWRLDRLGRSLLHLTQLVNQLNERGVGFRSLIEGFDTTTAGGKLIFHIFAALAEFERSIIRERTMAGLAAARARGRNGGRRSKLTARQIKVARQMYDEKGSDGRRVHTVQQIADTLNVSRPTIYRALEPAQ